MFSLNTMDKTTFRGGTILCQVIRKFPHVGMGTDLDGRLWERAMSGRPNYDCGPAKGFLDCFPKEAIRKQILKILIE